MTISYGNDDIRRAQIVNFANGLLRHRFGYTPKTSNLRGPSFFAKAVLQKLVRDSKWVKRERNARRPIDFRLDATSPARSSICRRRHEPHRHDGADDQCGAIGGEVNAPRVPDSALS